MGRCFQQMGQSDLAIHALERYLTDAPKGARRADVEQLIATLRAPVVDPVAEVVPGGLRVAFELPRGAYATSVLRELLVDTIWFGPGDG